MSASSGSISILAIALLVAVGVAVLLLARQMYESFRTKRDAGLYRNSEFQRQVRKTNAIGCALWLVQLLLIVAAFASSGSVPFLVLIAILSAATLAARIRLTVVFRRIEKHLMK